MPALWRAAAVQDRQLDDCRPELLQRVSAEALETGSDLISRTRRQNTAAATSSDAGALCGSAQASKSFLVIKGSARRLRGVSPLRSGERDREEAGHDAGGGRRADDSTGD